MEAARRDLVRLRFAGVALVFCVIAGCMGVRTDPFHGNWREGARFPVALNFGGELVEFDDVSPPQRLMLGGVDVRGWVEKEPAEQSLSWLLPKVECRIEVAVIEYESEDDLEDVTTRDVARALRSRMIGHYAQAASREASHPEYDHSPFIGMAYRAAQDLVWSSPVKASARRVEVVWSAALWRVGWFGGAAALGVIGVVMGFRSVRGIRWAGQDRCGACGFALDRACRDLDRCPECGRRIGDG